MLNKVNAGRAPITFFEQAHIYLKHSSRKTAEIGQMMESMYRKFSAKHALALTLPMAFSRAARLKVIVAPLEAQIRLHKGQFKHRLPQEAGAVTLAPGCGAVEAEALA